MTTWCFRFVVAGALVLLAVGCSTGEAPPTATQIVLPPTPTSSQETPLPQAARLQQAVLPNGGTLATGKINSAALAGNLLGDPTDRKFMVYLPEGYDASDERYPVAYVLHWYPGNYQTLAWSMSAELDQLIADGKLPPMILVFPDGHNRLGGSFFMSSPTIGDYETYITREVVNLIDSTYRTIPDPASRGITGCSMGGTGSLHLALAYPGVFGVAAPMSAGFEWDKWPQWESANGIAFLGHDPQSLEEFDLLSHDTKYVIAAAAVAAPNSDAPPFFADLPYQFKDGEPVVVGDVVAKIIALDPAQDLNRYLDQPLRLRALLIYTDTGGFGGSETQDLLATRQFHERLSHAGVEHEYAEVRALHCDFPFPPVLEFLGHNLAQ